MVLKGKNFKKKFNQVFGQVLEETILAKTTNCLGLFMHFTEIYLEELAKVWYLKMMNSNVSVWKVF